MDGTLPLAPKALRRFEFLPLIAFFRADTFRAARTAATALDGLSSKDNANRHEQNYDGDEGKCNHKKRHFCLLLSY